MYEADDWQTPSHKVENAAKVLLLKIQINIASVNYKAVIILMSQKFSQANA